MKVGMSGALVKESRIKPIDAIQCTLVARNIPYLASWLNDLE